MYDALTTKTDEPELKFKYEEKLRELGVYDEFVECYKNHILKMGYNPIMHMNFVNESETFYRFICRAFVWDETKQKGKVWSEIANS